jgi:hypothetical protein
MTAAQTATRLRVPLATSALDEAVSAWRLANWRERSHADRCPKLARGYRCGRCLDLEAEQNCAANRVAMLRRRAS